MSAVNFVGHFIEEWSRSRHHCRNILIAGVFDDRALKKIIKNTGQTNIVFVSGASLKKSVDIGVVLADMEPDQLLIISRLEDVPQAVLDIFIALFTGNKINLQVGDPPRDVTIDLPHFSLICTIGSNYKFSREIFEMFDVKVLLGNNVEISTAVSKPVETSGTKVRTDKSLTPKISLDFTVISHEMSIILRIDSYLGENPDWYQSISYTPADEPGGTYSVLVRGGTKDLAQVVYDKFKWIGHLAIEHDGKVFIGGL